MPTFGSLFSGIGGLDLGLERAGLECRWQVEIDDFCTKVLTKHWPDVPKYGDIKELTGAELEPVDLIAGGFPCQPVSVAGLKRGSDDERWLWPEFLRLIRTLQPRGVLVENVPGLLRLGMGDVLGGLAEIGYDAEWDCVPAAALGAEHQRERIFIVAHPHGTRCSFWGEARANGTHAPVLSPWDRLAVGASTAGLERRGETRWSGDVHGIPRRVDRVRALGNAVVPQVAEYVGRRILAVLT